MFRTIKKTWRLVIGLCLAMSGYSHIPVDAQAGRLTLMIGVAFILWHAVGLLRSARSAPRQ